MKNKYVLLLLVPVIAFFFVIVGWGGYKVISHFVTERNIEKDKNLAASILKKLEEENTLNGGKPFWKLEDIQKSIDDLSDFRSFENQFSQESYIAITNDGYKICLDDGIYQLIGTKENITYQKVTWLNQGKCKLAFNIDDITSYAQQYLDKEYPQKYEVEECWYDGTLGFMSLDTATCRCRIMSVEQFQHLRVNVSNLNMNLSSIIYDENELINEKD